MFGKADVKGLVNPGATPPWTGLSGDPSFLLPELPAFVESIGKAHVHG